VNTIFHFSHPYMPFLIRPFHLPAFRRCTLLLLLVLLIPMAGPVAAQVSGEEPLMSDREISNRVAGLARLYSIDSIALSAYDKIITYEREVFVGKIYNITFSDVRFTCPPDYRLNSIAKSRISQILYADGRRDVFIPLEGRTVKQKDLVDTSKIIVKTQKDWIKVLITEDPAEVEDLTAITSLKAKYEADMGNMDNEELMRQAGIILKKKAAMVKAHCVLIETKFFTNSYGDLPKVEVTARAFGY
jgi:hypothetical protein